MATEEAVLISASLAETWDAYFDPEGWRQWVDGFAAVIDSDGYPHEAGTLRWQSIPAGRGEVVETVLRHEPRRLHLVEFSDPAMTGTLETRFGVEGEATNVTQALEYRLLARGPLARLAALLFVRGQLRASMRRSLLALRRRVEEASE